MDDGRRVRRDRNRDSVVDAMLDLYNDGNYAPSADEIAERAGLSARSLFRYFEDIDDLCRVAISHQIDRVRPALDIEVRPDAPLADRVEAFVEQRLRLFEAIGSIGHVSRIRAPFQAVVAAELTVARSFLRHQISRLFAPELAAMSPALATGMLGAVDVVTSFEGYHLLRDDQQMTNEQIGDTFTTSLLRLLAPA
jgi:AcrR family transcriptional regulator